METNHEGVNYEGVLTKLGFRQVGFCEYASAVRYTKTDIDSHNVIVDLHLPLFPEEKSFLAIELPVSLVPPSGIFDEESVQDYYELISQYVSKIAESQGLALSENGVYAFKIQGDEELTITMQLETAVNAVMKIRNDNPEGRLAQVVKEAVGEKRKAYNSALEELLR